MFTLRLSASVFDGAHGLADSPPLTDCRTMGFVFPLNTEDFLNSGGQGYASWGVCVCCESTIGFKRLFAGTFHRAEPVLEGRFATYKVQALQKQIQSASENRVNGILRIR